MYQRSNHKLLGKKAQTTVEYLLFMAIMIVTFLFFMGSRGSWFSRTLEDAMTTNVNSMTQVTDNIFEHPN